MVEWGYKDPQRGFFQLHPPPPPILALALALRFLQVVGLLAG